MTISAERLAVRRRKLVEAAHTLIRETGNAGFSMLQLAQQAGVSPATPYNLIGSKSDLLKLVVQDEFDRFQSKLTAAPDAPAFDRILGAVDLTVRHYTEDPAFYAGLYKAAQSTESSEIGRLMMIQGRALWSGLMQVAVDTRDLEGFVEIEPLTDAFLRVMVITTEAWFFLGWTEAEFAQELGYAVRLMLASVASPARRAALVAEIRSLQDLIISQSRIESPGLTKRAAGKP